MQNSMVDLYGIMNVLDSRAYGDEDAFLERFGRGMPTFDQVQDLQVGQRMRGPKLGVSNLWHLQNVDRQPACVAAIDCACASAHLEPGSRRGSPALHADAW